MWLTSAPQCSSSTRIDNAKPRSTRSALPRHAASSGLTSTSSPTNGSAASAMPIAAAISRRRSSMGAGIFDGWRRSDTISRVMAWRVLAASVRVRSSTSMASCERSSDCQSAISWRAAPSSSAKPCGVAGSEKSSAVQAVTACARRRMRSRRCSSRLPFSLSQRSIWSPPASLRWCCRSRRVALRLSSASCWRCSCPDKPCASMSSAAMYARSSATRRRSR